MKKIVFLFLLAFSQTSYAQVDLSNPNAAVYTHLFYLQPDSYEPEKAAQTIYGKTGEEAVTLSIKLKKILDGNGLKVDFSRISSNPNYLDTLGGSDQLHNLVLFPVRMPSISVSKYDDKWYYSTETVDKIDALYDSTFSWSLEGLATLLPASIAHQTFLKLEIWQWLALLLIVLVSFLIFYILQKIIHAVLRKMEFNIFKVTSEGIELAVRKLSRPIVLLIILGVVRKVLPSLHINLDTNTFLFLVLDVFQTVFWIYVFLKLIQVAMSIYTVKAENTDSKLDDQLIPILNNFLVGLVVFVGLLHLLPIFGIDIKTVIMGASIGGLAVALASQDTVKNLIGTVMIFLDKPFHIGDWIEADGIEGTVEEVRFRSSKIRAADTSIFQIPNSKLSEMTINNKGRRIFRRYNTELGLRYDTPSELIEAFKVGLEKLIIAHPNINNDNFKVAFVSFGDFSLNIMLNLYFEILDWGPVQTAKHQFHIAVVELAKELNVEFAFPSQTLMMEKSADENPVIKNYNADPEYINSAIEKVLKNLKVDDLAHNELTDNRETED